MTTIQLVEELLSVAQTLGFEVREDWFSGHGGGICIVKGQKQLYVDLAQTVEEQLQSMVQALRSEPLLLTAQMSSELNARFKALAKQAA